MAVKLTKISKNGAPVSEYTYDMGHHITAYIHSKKSTGWDSWQRWELDFQHSGVTVYSPYLRFTTRLSDVRELLEGMQEFFDGDPEAAWNAWGIAKEERRQAAFIAQKEYNDRCEAAKAQHLLDILSEHMTPEAAQHLLADERLSVEHRQFYSVPKDRLPGTL